MTELMNERVSEQMGEQVTTTHYAVQIYVVNTINKARRRGKVMLMCNEDLKHDQETLTSSWYCTALSKFPNR